MELIEEPLSPRSSARIVRPKSIEDRAMFLHCSGGAETVSLFDFDETVLPLLMAHNIFPVTDIL